MVHQAVHCSDHLEVHKAVLEAVVHEAVCETVHEAGNKDNPLRLHDLSVCTTPLVAEAAASETTGLRDGEEELPHVRSIP